MRRALVCLVLATAGCPDRSISMVEPLQAAAFTKDIPVEANLDVLFVIDDSGSTRDKQALFARNYPNFVAALAAFPGGLPNLHLGVVTTSVDVGPAVSATACHPVRADGLLQNAPRDPGACAQPTTDRFLIDVAKPGGGRTTNYAGSLSDALSCISNAGEGGCGLEAPLEAMKRALDGSHPENVGFLRREALLAVVILTDEDDCSADPALFEQPLVAADSRDFTCAQAGYLCDRPISATPGSYAGCRPRHDSLLRDPRAYAGFLEGLKGSTGAVVALIAGDPSATITTGPLTTPFVQSLAVQPSCHVVIDGAPTIARPAVRLDEFRRAFGDRGLFRTVCQEDYSGALLDVGTLLRQVLSPCLEGTLDTRDRDAASPGLQPDCTVSELQDAGTDEQVEAVIAPCRMIAEGQPDLGGAPACWWVAESPACATETHLELRLERSAPPPPGSLVRVSCAAAPAPAELR